MTRRPLILCSQIQIEAQTHDSELDLIGFKVFSAASLRFLAHVALLQFGCLERRVDQGRTLLPHGSHRSVVSRRIDHNTPSLKSSRFSSFQRRSERHFQCAMTSQLIDQLNILPSLKAPHFYHVGTSPQFCQDPQPLDRNCHIYQLALHRRDSAHPDT